MSEFGHTAINSGGVCLDSWGVGPFIIEAAGKRFRFEDSDRFGPYLCTRLGDPLRTQPGSRSPFWRAHRIWVRQGRRVADDGMACIWTEPAPTVIRRLSKRHVLVVQRGEEDGATVEETENGA